MPTIDRGGVEIYYETHGDGERTLLLSHGYTATTRMWSPQLPRLSEVCRVVVWDMRGHGRSASPDDGTLYSEAATVADMAALLDEVGADSAAIAGLSLGGYMSLAFHREHADRTAALLLFDTGPGYKNPDARAAWNRNSMRRAESFESDGLAALGPGREVRAAEHRSAQGLAHAARGMLAQSDDRVIRSLPEIEVPTLVVVGSLDEPFLAASDYMATKIPGAVKVVIEGAGHAANLDRPEEFTDAVVTFLEGLPS